MMRRPRYHQDAEAVFVVAKASYTPSVAHGATRSSEGLGPVRLPLAEKYVAARMLFGAIYGGVGICFQLVASPTREQNWVGLIRLNPIPRAAIIHFTALRDALICDYCFWRALDRAVPISPSRLLLLVARPHLPGFSSCPRAELTNSRSAVLNRSAASGFP